MPDLIRLPLRAIDLATRPTRFVIGKLLRARTAAGGGSVGRRDEGQPAASEAPGTAAARPRPASSRPQPTRTAPSAPRRTRTPPTKAARRAVRNEPTKGQAGEIRMREHMAEQEAGGPGPGATVAVAEPWDGYGAMSEGAVLERLIGADPTLRAVVRLYESTHGQRRQILIATEESVAS